MACGESCSLNTCRRVIPCGAELFLFVRIENGLEGLTDVNGELNCNIAAMRVEAKEK